MTPKQLAANRRNAQKAGRPKGSLNAHRLSLRERINMSQEEIVERLFFLMRKGENHAVQLAAARELLDRGWGRPVQVSAVGVDGVNGPVVVHVITGVPRADNWSTAVSTESPLLNSASRFAEDDP